MLRRLLPHPLLSLLLAVVWLMLVNDVTLNAVVFGAIMAFAIPQATSAYWTGAPQPRNLPALVEYLAVVLYDIVMANIVVARIILTKPNAQIESTFFTIPLDLRSPEAITLLAGTISLTPGTVSSDLSADGRSLLVHALDAHDPDAVRDLIKSRYEARLMKVFQ